VTTNPYNEVTVVRPGENYNLCTIKPIDLVNTISFKYTVTG